MNVSESRSPASVIRTADAWSSQIASVAPKKVTGEMFSVGQYVSDAHEYVRTFVRSAVGALLVPASDAAAPWPISDDASDDAAP